MMKYRVVYLCAAVATLTCLATAQSSQVRSSSTSAKRDPDSLQNATKPLTPKSAMPAQHKSSAAPLNAPKSGGNTSAELTRLERQPVKADGSSRDPKEAAKPPAVPKPGGTSASGPGINYKYQKPAGGLTATTPNANSKNSSVPRVTKKN